MSLPAQQLMRRSGSVVAGPFLSHDPRMSIRSLAEERSRLFGQEAERYDRCRPRYPDVVIDEMLGPAPAGLDVLDVGCGTGIASRQVAERGANVLGVEAAPRMAEIARSHGIEVEVAPFEDWDAAGRTFDHVISAQAWHWLDLPVSTAKAASLLRPGGRLCLVWNAGCHPDDLADAIAEVYARWFPAITAGFGYAANRPTDRRSGLTPVVEAIAAVPEFSPATETWFPWAHRYDRDQWLDVLRSRSDHAALDAVAREPLFEEIEAAIDERGGSFVMSFETGLIAATRLA